MEVKHVVMLNWEENLIQQNWSVELVVMFHVLRCVQNMVLTFWNINAVTVVPLQFSFALEQHIFVMHVMMTFRESLTYLVLNCLLVQQVNITFCFIRTVYFYQLLCKKLFCLTSASLPLKINVLAYC